MAGLGEIEFCPFMPGCVPKVALWDTSRLRLQVRPMFRSPVYLFTGRGNSAAAAGSRWFELNQVGGTSTSVLRVGFNLAAAEPDWLTVINVFLPVSDLQHPL